MSRRQKSNLAQNLKKPEQKRNTVCSIVPSSMLRLWLSLLVYTASCLVQGYQRGFNPSIVRRSLSLKCVEYSRDIAPSAYADIEKECVSSLMMALQTDERQLLAVNVLTPGLNPKLEQKAMLLQEYLFDLIIAMLPTLQLRFKQVKIMFQSIGDAASFNKYHNIDGNVVLTDVDIRRMSDDDDCVLFITTKNHVGDPVIDTVKKIVDSYSDTTCIFLNCDLSDKVTTGIVDKGKRDNFRSTIQTAYYFRNLVEIVRPELIPIEIGIIQYTYGKKWEILGCYSDDIIGPGSLNRFMKQAVFKRDKLDPTASNPPRYIKVNSYSAMPSRDEIDAALAKSNYLQASYEKNMKKNMISSGVGNNLNEKLKKYLAVTVTDDLCAEVIDLTIQGAVDLPNIDKNYYKILNNCFRWIESVAHRSQGTSADDDRSESMGVVDITDKFSDLATSKNIETRLSASKLELIYEVTVRNNEIIKFNLPTSTNNENVAARIGNTGDTFQFNTNKKSVARQTSMGIIPVSTSGSYKLDNGKMTVTFDPINLFGFVWSKTVEQFVLEFKYINQKFVVVTNLIPESNGQTTYVVLKVLS
jgi:hypothetical protein